MKSIKCEVLKSPHKPIEPIKGCGSSFTLEAVEIDRSPPDNNPNPDG
ncbi:MAG: hypothetical protein WBC69_07180 [Geitlerinemataceae cyanobacterium]